MPPKVKVYDLIVFCFFHYAAVANRPVKIPRVSWGYRGRSAIEIDYHSSNPVENSVETSYVRLWFHMAYG